MTNDKLERHNKERFGEDGKKLSQQLSTDKNGVGVWPNAISMRDESRSRSN